MIFSIFSGFSILSDPDEDDEALDLDLKFWYPNIINIKNSFTTYFYPTFLLLYFSPLIYSNIHSLPPIASLLISLKKIHYFILFTIS